MDGSRKSKAKNWLIAHNSLLRFLTFFVWYSHYLFNDTKPAIVDDMGVDSKLLHKVDKFGVDAQELVHGWADPLEIEFNLDVDHSA